jgi:hypothetical protein
MGVSMWWDEADSALFHAKLTKPWAWEDYLKRVEEAIAVIKTRSEIIDAIVEIDSAGSISSGSIMGQLSKILKILPDNMGTIVVIINNDFLRMINTLMIRISARAQALVVLADTLEEAEAVIIERRNRRGRGVE